MYFKWKHFISKRYNVYIVVVWVGSAPLLIMRMHVATATYLPPKKKFLEHNKNYNNSANNDKKKMF